MEVWDYTFSLDVRERLRTPGWNDRECIWRGRQAQGRPSCFCHPSFRGRGDEEMVWDTSIKAMIITRYFFQSTPSAVCISTVFLNLRFRFLDVNLGFDGRGFHIPRGGDEDKGKLISQKLLIQCLNCVTDICSSSSVCLIPLLCPKGTAWEQECPVYTHTHKTFSFFILENEKIFHSRRGFMHASI